MTEASNQRATLPLLVLVGILIGAVSGWLLVRAAPHDTPSTGQSTAPGAHSSKPRALKSTPANRPEFRETVRTESTAPTPTGSGDEVADNRATLHGRVLEASTGDPVAAARISVTSAAMRDEIPELIAKLAAQFATPIRGLPVSATTDENGRFACPVDSNEQGVVLIVQGSDSTTFVPARIPVPVMADEVTVRLLRAASVSGAMTGVPSDVEAEVVAIKHDRRSLNLGLGTVQIPWTELAKTGTRAQLLKVEDGGVVRFEISGLEPGVRYVVAGVLAGTHSLCSSSVDVQTPVSGVALTFIPGTKVVVRPVDNGDGTAIDDVRVRVRTGAQRGGLVSVITPEFELEPRIRPGGGLEVPLPPSATATEGVTLVFAAEGYRTTTTQRLHIQPNQLLDIGRVLMQRVPVLAVTVVDAQTQAPVSGASVRLEPPTPDGVSSVSLGGVHSTVSIGRPEDTPVIPDQIITGETNADGKARLTWDLEGPAVLAVAVDGYRRSQEPLPERPTPGVLERRVELLRGGRVVVNVLDADGDPVPGIPVLRRGEPFGVPTDDRGRVLFTGLDPGPALFRTSDNTLGAALMNSMEAVTGDDEPGPGWTAVDVIEGGTSFCTLRLKQTATVVGTVRDAAGRGVGRCTIRLVPGPAGSSANAGELIARTLHDATGFDLGGVRALTGSDGAFELLEVPVGRHRLRAEHADFARPTEVEVDVVAGTQVVDLVFASASVRGRVIDLAGVPIRNARVRVVIDDNNARGMNAALGELIQRAASGEQRTDREGRFVLRGLPAGDTMGVRVEHGFHLPRTIDIRVTDEAGELQLSDIALEPAGRILVRSRTVGTVRCEWLGASESAPRLDDIRTGSTLLASVRPGRWRVTFTTGDSEATKDITVSAGATARVDFD